MKRVTVVHGMKRSGNHAIINWLKAHDRHIFFNNVIPIAPILRGEKKMPPAEPFNLWLRRKLDRRNLKFPFLIKKFYLRRHSLIVSLEDHDLQVRPFLNVPGGIRNILILRDPRNMFSSRIRKGSKGEHPAFPTEQGPNMNLFLALWKTYAREYLGLTNYLENKVCIYFDRWFSDQHYRQSISQKLDIEFTDSGFTQVSQKGGGSSFDGMQFDGKNAMMEVLNRQSYLTDSERYLLDNILADEELTELAQRITDSHISV